MPENPLSLWSPAFAHDSAVTILMGILVAVACGWLGCWMILQGLALVGDAISHTVLLGIVIAVLVTGEVTGIGMFVAATLTGLVTVVLIDVLHVSSRLKEDAAIGIVFTSLFALGVVLLTVFASRAHIDAQDSIYGKLEIVASRPGWMVGGVEIPIAVFRMAAIAAVLLGLIVVFYKELLLVAFDRQLAASVGMRPHLFRYGMLAALSLTAVGSFEAVGPVLVVAMLIAPAATAYLLTRRLPMMLFLSALIGSLSAVIGYHISFWFSVSAAGSMACAACGLFSLAFLLAPEQGLIAGAWRRLRLRLKTGRENIIRRVWKLSAGRPEIGVASREVAAALALPGWRYRWLVRSLVRRGWVDVAHEPAEGLRLTDGGRVQAQRLDRAHRLWETFLVDTVGLSVDHVHPAAEEVEHVLSEQLVERLDDALGHPDIDPHGAPIPRSQVSDQTPGVFVLSKLRAGDRGRIAGLVPPFAASAFSTHDQGPALVEIARLGLTLGQSVEVRGRAPTVAAWVVVVDTRREIEIPHALADVILVRLDASLPSISS
ncbi:MAG: hypothetical protein EXS05_12870 [Planctomycetaceae bacterium]|nr:hypothetical protein [Planctomycetaceae bacterium]